MEGVFLIGLRKLKLNLVLYSTVLYITVQYSKVLYSTVQFSKVK